jgi:RHS repeat-associated protein
LANYTVNTLNQITQRDYPGTNDVIGVALATNSVTVNGQTAWRKGEYFQALVKSNNTAAAQWEGIKVISGSFTNSGNLHVPKTPEQFSYDADGNLTNDGHWAYVWDAENRLIQMTVNTNVGPQYQLNFAYDPKDRRIQKQVVSNSVALYTNRFLYDGWNLIAELKPNNSPIRTYVWGTDLSGSLQGAGGVGGLLEVSYYGTSTTNCFLAYDGNGNVMNYVNAADGVSVAQLEYDPFLNVIRATGPLANLLPFLGSTKYYDWESGDYYYGYRYYGPSWGGWPNRDPLTDYSFFKNSIRGQSIRQIKQLRAESLMPAYIFVGNNPVGKFDADGRLTITVPPWLLSVGVGVGLGYCIDKFACARWRDLQLGWAESVADANAPDGTTHRGANSPAGGDADLLTHCIAACELTKKPGPCFGPDGALDSLQARETGNDVPTQIDRANNEAGVGVGISVGKNGDCLNGCLDALNKGLLTTIVNGQPAPSSNGGRQR